MKRLLILIGAICYCVAPDLFAGPIDDTLILLATMAYSAMVEGRDRSPEYVKEYMKMNRQV